MTGTDANNLEQDSANSKICQPCMIGRQEAHMSRAGREINRSCLRALVTGTARDAWHIQGNFQGGDSTALCPCLNYRPRMI